MMRLHLTDPWTIAATVAYSAVVLITYAVMSRRWPHRWLIVLTSLQCLSLLLIPGQSRSLSTD
ncbi:MAG: hypothetical protein DCF28_07495 [Alphaproteobacteria bacterium]|nr:MAG: hypothetical protein DCF28_07495 [Alphaproteobacteria bacterium]PZO36342.1 MAG: hypothetical protein DCE92_09015 [Alphaproteobacteria bacterium]